MCVHSHTWFSKSTKEGFNPKTGESTRTLRSTVEEVPGNLLRLAAQSSLFPVDDVEAAEPADGRPHGGD